MKDHFAFTADYWGDAAVVCRAVEDKAGPLVEQEFGEFKTWTQANAFATRLNDGLEIYPAEAEQIVTESILRTSDLLREADTVESVGGFNNKTSLRTESHLKFVLAELDLATTFCRVVRSYPSQNTNRLLRNARNALFNGMHYVLHSGAATQDLIKISARLGNLQAALREATSQSKN